MRLYNFLSLSIDACENKLKEIAESEMRDLYRNDMECTHEREILQQRKEELRVRKLKKFNRLESKTEPNGEVYPFI